MLSAAGLKLRQYDQYLAWCISYLVGHGSTTRTLALHEKPSHFPLSYRIVSLIILIHIPVSQCSLTLAACALTDSLNARMEYHSASGSTCTEDWKSRIAPTDSEWVPTPRHNFNTMPVELLIVCMHCCCTFSYSSSTDNPCLAGYRPTWIYIYIYIWSAVSFLVLGNGKLAGSWEYLASFCQRCAETALVSLDWRHQGKVTGSLDGKTRGQGVIMLGFWKNAWLWFWKRVFYFVFSMISTPCFWEKPGGISKTRIFFCIIYHYFRRSDLRY